jgi:lysophospholipase L1-like esterase
VSDVLTQETPVVPADATIITIAVGVNDEVNIARGREKLADVVRDLQAINADLHERAPGAKIVWATPEDRASLYGTHAPAAIVAATHAATYALDRAIETLGPVAHVGDAPDYYSPAHFNNAVDVIHPNDAGAAFIASRVAATILRPSGF